MPKEISSIAVSGAVGSANAKMNEISRPYRIGRLCRRRCNSIPNSPSTPITVIAIEQGSGIGGAFPQMKSSKATTFRLGSTTTSPLNREERHPTGWRAG